MDQLNLMLVKTSIKIKVKIHYQIYISWKLKSKFVLKNFQLNSTFIEIKINVTLESFYIQNKSNFNKNQDLRVFLKHLNFKFKVRYGKLKIHSGLK